MMTRKHYQEFARVLGEANRHEAISPEWITSSLIAVMVADNPNFDRAKFWLALKAEQKKEAN